MFYLECIKKNINQPNLLFMKNLLCLLCLLFLFSCSNDDETLSETIVGTWTLTTLSIDGCSDADNNVTAIDADASGCLTINDTNLCQTVTFNANGTLVNVSITEGVTEAQDRTYTVDDATNMVTTCDMDNNCSTFGVVDGTLSLSFPFGDCSINSTYTK